MIVPAVGHSAQHDRPNAKRLQQTGRQPAARPVAGVEDDPESPTADGLDVHDLEHPAQMSGVRILDAALTRPSPSHAAQASSRCFHRSSSARPCSAPSTIPAGWKNFNPLYCGGLCDAEIWIAPANRDSRTSQPIVGVATGPSSRASCPVAVTADSTAAANTGAESRPSCPTTIGPGPHPPA